MNNISDIKSKERIFPILNKIDRIWTVKSDQTFCEIIKELVNDNLSDSDLTKKLENYIDEQRIK